MKKVVLKKNKEKPMKSSRRRKKQDSKNRSDRRNNRSRDRSEDRKRENSPPVKQLTKHSKEKRGPKKKKTWKKPTEPLVFKLHWKFEFFFIITLAFIFILGLNPPAIMILFIYAMCIFCNRKKLVIDWQEDTITCGRAFESEPFQGKISDLASIILFEKHYKEGRENEIYEKGSAFQSYHDRQTLGMIFNFKTYSEHITFYKFGNPTLTCCRQVSSERTKLFEDYMKVTEYLDLNVKKPFQVKKVGYCDCRECSLGTENAGFAYFQDNKL